MSFDSRMMDPCRRRLLATGVGAALAAVALLAPSATGLPPRAGSPDALRQHFQADTSRLHAAAVAGDPAAEAPAANLEPCEQAGPDGFCGTVEVPLDRGHPGRGTVPIFFLFYPHRDPGPASEAILVTSGGPGFSLASEPPGVDYHRGVFDPLLDTRDLIFLDQRGVGQSDAIDCPQIQHGTDHPYRDIAACADQLGFAASLYTSGEVALDIEAVRRALGIKKLNFYGGSYAAVDIQAYAVRFPHRLRSAVLDSPATVLPYDFDAPVTQAFNRTLRLICARSQSCSAERADALADVAWLARRLRREPLEGVGFDSVGEPHQLRVTEGDLLWDILWNSEGGFVSPSEIPAAADALRAGDPVPLLRLAAEGDGPLLGDEGEPTTFSSGHNFARFCSDQPMPWDKRASFTTRLRQWLRARAALPRDAFAPYSIDAWLAPVPTGLFGPDVCIVWPGSKPRGEPPIPRGARFPSKVPALVLSGDLDTDTPTAEALQLARSWRGSRFLEVANSGHHTMVDGRFDCSGSIVVDFIAELRPGDTACASDTAFGLIPSVGRFALTAAGARPAARGDGDQSTRTDRKVGTVAAAAVTDAFRRAFLAFPGPVAGLRGGTFSFDLTPAGNGFAGDLDGMRFASDVSVSGTATYLFDDESIDASVTVDGPGDEDGELQISGAWFTVSHETSVLEVTGELGGRTVVLQVPAT